MPYLFLGKTCEIEIDVSAVLVTASIRMIFDIIMNLCLFVTSLCSQRFGKVINLLDKQQFLDAVDKEDPNIVVVVHLYSKVSIILRRYM